MSIDVCVYLAEQPPRIWLSAIAEGDRRPDGNCYELQWVPDRQHPSATVSLITSDLNELVALGQAILDAVARHRHHQEEGPDAP
jgi:hypothetical protein